ncbi:MAG: acyl-CoA thioesterase [Coprococcus sp.]
MELRDKTVADSRVETCHIIRPSDLNSVGRLFGGTLMAWIDEVAVLVAKRHSQMSVTTGSVDNLKFLKGAYLKDTIIISGKVTYVGNTSMEVKVETYVEHISGHRELINKAFLTLIGLDENDKPCRLPRLILQTDEDKLEWDRAERRRELRKQQKEDGFHFFS